MRTTIDLPDDLHAQATAIAMDTRQSLSQAVAGLIRRGLSTITTEDVRRLEDDG